MATTPATENLIIPAGAECPVSDCIWEGTGEAHAHPRASVLAQIIEEDKPENGGFGLLIVGAAVMPARKAS